MTSRKSPVRASTLDRAIEATWLLCAALVPLLIVPDTWMTGFVQVPKVFLLRTCALFLAVLMGMKWAGETGSVRGGTSAASGCSAPDLLKIALATTSRYLRAHPIMLAAASVLAANIISLLFSPLRTVSLGGVDPGWDSYSLASVASYLVLFVAIATNLQSVAQVRRLLWALTISSLVLSAYGIGQYAGFDFFLAEHPSGRIWLTFGNPIMGASYLLMTIPLTLALWQSWRERMMSPLHIVIGITLVAPQIAVLALTLSRGAMISMAFSLVVFVTLSLWVLGPKRGLRPATILTAGLGLALVVNVLPVPGIPQVGNDVVHRLSSIKSSLASEESTLQQRFTTWGYASTAFRSLPWANTDAFPEIPELTLKPLRRVVGYGPDMFRYAISYAASPERSPYLPGKWQNAHNFLIHAGIELGLLGVVAYLCLVVAVSLALYRLLLEAHRGALSESLGYIVIGLTAVLAGRGLEQMAGKAQVSDIALSWILAGVVMAIVRMRVSASVESIAEAETALRKRPARPLGPHLKVSPMNAISSRNIARAAASVLMVIGIMLWFATVVPTVRSSILVGEALRSSDPRQTGALMEQAISIAPGDVVPRLLLSGSILSGTRSDQDSDVKLTLLRHAYDTIGEVIERNPMDFKARVSASNISEAIMLLDPSFVSTAIRNREIDTALSPSLWKPRELLAATLFQVGRLDDAKDALNRALELGAAESDWRYYVLYLDARIQIERKDIEKAIDAIQAFKDAPHHAGFYEVLAETLDQEIKKALE
jgi:O-antigen ligase